MVTGDAEKYSDFYRDSKDLIFKEGTMLAFPLMFFYAIAYCVVNVGFLIFNFCLYFWIESISSDDDYPAHLVLCHFVNAVALVWIICHVYGFFKVSVSGAYGTWYWSMNKKEVPKFTTLRFIYIAFRYHIGPTAFGSLIIMVCTILQILLAYVETSGVDGTLGTDLCSCGLDCCDTALYILKAVIEAVTGMAYVHIGNHGTGFIDAARVSFTLFKRNYAKIAVITQVDIYLSILIF
uniref:Choline transporter-like protein n=1 Tax=Trichogramma kaykai TaxID=54128 RepID=A0ABD2WXJ3_9HYME